MTTEMPGRRKLTEPVPHHVLRYIYRNELFTIVHGKRVTHELRSYHRCPAPGFNNLFLTGLIQFVYLPLKLVVDEWTFF